MRLGLPELLIILSILLLLFGAKRLPSETVTELSTGEEVYEARCSACHGADLEGRVGPALDADSSSASMPDSYWVQTITMGKGSMPAQRLTDNEVQLVIDYIKSGGKVSSIKKKYSMNKDVEAELSEIMVKHHG